MVHVQGSKSYHLTLSPENMRTLYVRYTANQREHTATDEYNNCSICDSISYAKPLSCTNGRFFIMTSLSYATNLLSNALLVTEGVSHKRGSTVQLCTWEWQLGQFYWPSDPAIIRPVTRRGPGVVLLKWTRSWPGEPVATLAGSYCSAYGAQIRKGKMPLPYTTCPKDSSEVYTHFIACTTFF